MKEIKSLNLSQCWTMVNRISNMEQVAIAEEWLKKANITTEEWDELMMAVSYIYRELSKTPNHRFE